MRTIAGIATRPATDTGVRTARTASMSMDPVPSAFIAVVLPWVWDAPTAMTGSTTGWGEPGERMGAGEQPKPV